MIFENKKQSSRSITQFDPASFSGTERFTRIGTGSLGAKAQGLLNIKEILENKIVPLFEPAIHIDIPLLAAIATDYFDQFMNENELYKKISAPWTDKQIAHIFQKAELPAQLEKDLHAFVAKISVPLAVRSSSLLEDALGEPFAGVYATKMIPNNQRNPEDRLRALIDAIRYIYASTFFKEAKQYITSTQHNTKEEKMAVIIQEVVGACYNDRFYPHISGVARSFNFYPTGLSQPEEGVVDIALGLGKIIVDDSIAWSFSPSYPHVNPPYNTIRDLLKQTQKDFWAIDVRRSRKRRFGDEIEYLKKCTLSDAEKDGILAFIASTYKAEDEKIVIGIMEPGPRIVNFAQILKTSQIPLVELLKKLLKSCEESLGTMVNIEFALTFPHTDFSFIHFGFLQIRPMVVSHSLVVVNPDELLEENVLVASESTLGNGIDTSIQDIVYVKPQNFLPKHTHSIGLEIETINMKLVIEKYPYVLIGFGRWGSSDPSAGIPINFGQISGARVIIESTLPDIDFISSQGSHFFHNITSSKILYFPVSHSGNLKIDWAWLDQQKAVMESNFIRHIRLSTPLQIKVDGRTKRGVILK